MTEPNGKLSLEQMLAGLGPALFSSIRTPFGIFDRDCRIVWINKAMAAIHQCDWEMVAGESCRRVFQGCNHVCNACILKEVIKKGRTMVAEQWADFPGGERRWGEVHAYPVRGLDRSVSAVIVIVFETTASKHALQQQRDYTELLEQRLSEKENGPRKVNLDGGEMPICVKLSRRETDVLRLITEGYTNTQISELLDISANTVKSYVNGVFNKLGVNDRTQAAVLATRNHLV
jgi:PAS domain S-box-containing protein